MSPDDLAEELPSGRAKTFLKVLSQFPELAEFRQGRGDSEGAGHVSGVDVGALHGQRAMKGVLITTSTFSPAAVDFADDVTPRIRLVNGEELAELMIAYDVGVSVDRTDRLKRLDSDYFATDESDVPASAEGTIGAS